jgi:hypothetical protein
MPPAPRALPVWTGQPGVIPVGYVPGPDGKERLLGMPLADLFFSLRVGKSRYGKTETALVQAVALALHSTDGVWFLDPHADGWQRARPLLTGPQVLARLWEVDLTVRGDDAKIAGYNPLDMTGQNAGQIEDRVDAVVAAISSALSWGDSAPRAKTILTKSCETLCHLGLRLPPDCAPTLFQIRTLLDDPDWRETVLPFVPGSLQWYWERTFPRYPAEATPVITNVIERIAASRTLSAFFGSPRSTYDVRAAMDDGNVVFVCPPGGELGKLATCFLIYDLFRGGKSRGDLAAAGRRRFDAFIDEVTAVPSTCGMNCGRPRGRPLVLVKSSEGEGAADIGQPSGDVSAGAAPDRALAAGVRRSVCFGAGAAAVRAVRVRARAQRLGGGRAAGAVRAGPERAGGAVTASAGQR